jgi:hypothetical protein
MDTEVDLLGSDDETAPTRTPLDMLEAPPPRRAAVATPVDDSPFGGAVPTSFPQVGLPAVPQYGRSRVSAQAPRSAKSPPKYRTLEEMYTYHAVDLQKEGCQLRIQRISPQLSYDHEGRRVRTSGIIGRDTPNVTTEEFQLKYGGFKYQVFLEVPLDDIDDAFGAPKLITRAVAEFELPSEPNLTQLPGIDDDMSFNPTGRRYQTQGAPRYQEREQGGDSVSRVLDFASRTMQMGNPSVSAPSDVAFQALQAQGSAALGATKEMAQLQSEMLRAELDKKDREVAELRRAVLEGTKQPSDVEKIMQSVALLNNSQARTVTEENIEALRRAHSTDLEQLRSSHRDHVDSLMRQNEITLSGLRQTFEVQIKSLENRISEMLMAADRERSNMKDEIERREREAKRDGERNLDMARRDSERSMELVRAQYESRLQMLEQNAKSEKHMLQESYKLVSKSDENTSTMKLTILEQENNRLKAEINSMHDELEGARSDRNKPLAEQLQEIKTNAELLGLGGKDDGKPDIKDALMTAAIQNAPQILGALGALANRGAPPGAPGAPGGPPAVAALPPGPSGQPQQMTQNRGRPQRRQPPRMVFQEDDAPPIATRQAQRPDLYIENDAPPPVMRPTYGPPPEPMYAQEPIAQAPVVTTPPPAPSASLPPPARPVSVVPPPSAEDYAPFAWTMLPVENLQAFIGMLDGACSNEDSAEEVAAFLKQQVGVENLKLIAATMDVDKLCESILEAPATKDRVLATKRGQKFVRDVFSTIKAIVEAA